MDRGGDEGGKIVSGYCTLEQTHKGKQTVDHGFSGTWKEVFQIVEKDHSSPHCC